MPSNLHGLLPGKMVAVVHSVESWLEQTQTWIFTQVASLPSSVQSYICCETTKNLDQFYLPNIHSLDQAQKWRALWDKSLRKLHWRHHLGFLAAQMRAHCADILHSHFGPAGWSNLEVARQLGVKHVVTYYGYDVNYIPKTDPRWLDRYATLFDEVDLVLCEGPHMARCIAALGCPVAKLRVHHLGVMLDRIPFRPRCWYPGELFRVLIAASFREKKGIPLALEALGQIQHELDIEITIIGDAPGDVGEKQKIRDVIRKHNLESNVKMLGFQPHVVLFEEAYRNHVYLSPSVTASDGDTEGGVPVALIEMAATGMPVVSTVHCDIPEVIDHGVSGLLAEERDVEGLVMQLRWLTANPHAWLPMVSAAREHLDREFAAQIQGQRLADIYHRIVAA